MNVLTRIAFVCASLSLLACVSNLPSYEQTLAETNDVVIAGQNEIIDKLNSTVANLEAENASMQWGCVQPESGRFYFDSEAKVVNFKILTCDNSVLVWIFDYYNLHGAEERPTPDHST